MRSASADERSVGSGELVAGFNAGAFGWEFSNLGPIDTFFWDVMLDIYFATPVFVTLLIAKLIGSRGQTNA